MTPFGVIFLIIEIADKTFVLFNGASVDMFGDSRQLAFATPIIISGSCVVVQGFKKIFEKD